jgi:hypothetical protein
MFLSWALLHVANSETTVVISLDVCGYWAMGALITGLATWQNVSFYLPWNICALPVFRTLRCCDPWFYASFLVVFCVLQRDSDESKIG